MRLRAVCGDKKLEAIDRSLFNYHNFNVSLFSQDVDSHIFLVSGERKVDARLSYAKVSDRYLLEKFWQNRP